MGKRKEGEAEAKKGLPLSLTRPISWRVFGLIAQNERRYVDAAAAFVRASKFDQDNLTVLRDLAFYQAHIRDYEGLLQTRKSLILRRPENMIWMAGYAIALHLNGLNSQAAEVGKTFLASLEIDPKNPSETRYQKGEVALFVVKCLEADSQYENVLNYLEEAKDIIVDPISYNEAKGRSLLKLGKLDEAKEIYFKLLDFNQNNYAYLSGIQQAHGFPSTVEPNAEDFLPGSPFGSEEVTSGLTKLYDELTEKFPKSLTIPRIALNFAQKNDFKVRLEKYITPYLKKTIPSLFSTLKKLYIFEDKTNIIRDVFLSFEQSLAATNKLPTNNEQNDEIEAPSTYLWVLQYLAYHFDRLKNTSLALEYIDKAINHTPTLLELYLCKGKIYKHAGNPKLAFEFVNEARQFDLADRFLNTLAARYALRADLIDTALEIASLFATQNPEKTVNLDEMQCIWYEIERGESFYRQGEYAKALREFFYIDKHFNDMYDDQYDFHGYSLRKLTLNAYIDMLNYYDKSWAHHWFVRASLGIIDTYIEVFDKSLNKQPLTEEIIKFNATFEKENEKKAIFEIPPNGEMLLRVDSPLDKAVPFLRKLEQFSFNNPKVFERSIELNLRRDKPLQVLRSIKRLHSIDPENPYIYTAILKLCKNIQSIPDTIVKEVLFEELKEFGVDDKQIDKSLEQLVQKYSSRNFNSIRGRFGTIKLEILLSKTPSFKSIEDEKLIQETNIENLRSFYMELKKLNAPNLETFSKLVKNVFKWSTYFDSF